MLRENFGEGLFSIEQAEEFTLGTPFRDNGHLKPQLKLAEKENRLRVIRAAGKRAGSFPSGTRMQFV
jgi:hypothetical protein